MVVPAYSSDGDPASFSSPNSHRQYHVFTPLQTRAEQDLYYVDVVPRDNTGGHVTLPPHFREMANREAASFQEVFAIDETCCMAVLAHSPRQRPSTYAHARETLSRAPLVPPGPRSSLVQWRGGRDVIRDVMGW